MLRCHMESEDIFQLPQPSGTASPVAIHSGETYVIPALYRRPGLVGAGPNFRLLPSMIRHHQQASILTKKPFLPTRRLLELYIDGTQDVHVNVELYTDLHRVHARYFPGVCRATLYRQPPSAECRNGITTALPDALRLPIDLASQYNHNGHS
jgi:hypothetical protein